MSWLDDLLYGYRTIRNAALSDSPARAILKIVGATITDDPTTGATIITIADGTPLASITGSTWISVGPDPLNPVVSISPAPTSTATPERLVVRDASGDIYAADFYASNGFIAVASGNFDVHHATAIAGNGADGSITAQAGTQSGNRNGGNLLLSGGLGFGTGVAGGAALQVGGVTAFRVGVEASLGGAKVAYLGVSAAPAGMLIPGDCTACEIMFLERADAGNARDLAISGSSASDGNGGDVQITSGSKGGGGTSHGAVVIGSGGTQLLRCQDGVSTIGDVSNNTTASVILHGPTGTTVGAAGAASALPATPDKYLKILVGATTYVLPLYTAP